MNLWTKLIVTLFALALFLVPTPVTDLAAISIIGYVWGFTKTT